MSRPRRRCRTGSEKVVQPDQPAVGKRLDVVQPVVRAEPTDDYSRSEPQPVELLRSCSRSARSVSGTE